jgi:uncharacterized protein YfkK (UPF0435 family)
MIKFSLKELNNLKYNLDFISNSKNFKSNNYLIIDLVKNFVINKINNKKLWLKLKKYCYYIYYLNKIYILYLEIYLRRSTYFDYKIILLYEKIFHFFITNKIKIINNYYVINQTNIKNNKFIDLIYIYKLYNELYNLCISNIYFFYLNNEHIIFINNILKLFIE